MRDEKSEGRLYVPFNTVHILFCFLYKCKQKQKNWLNVIVRGLNCAKYTGQYSTDIEGSYLSLEKAFTSCHLSRTN